MLEWQTWFIIPRPKLGDVATCTMYRNAEGDWKRVHHHHAPDESQAALRVYQNNPSTALRIVFCNAHGQPTLSEWHPARACKFTLPTEYYGAANPHPDYRRPQKTKPIKR